MIASRTRAPAWIKRKRSLSSASKLPTIDESTDIEAEAPYISEADFKLVVHQMDDALRTGMTLFREAFEAA